MDTVEQGNITLTGGFKATSASNEPVAISNRKTIALFAYLILGKDQEHGRDKLIGHLWPDLPESDAKNNLRVTWARLNKFFKKANFPAEGLQSKRQSLRYSPQGSIGIDVLQIKKLISEQQSCDCKNSLDCPLCLRRRMAVSDLYQGPFLDGFFLEGCHEFEEWLMLERENLHLEVMGILDALAAQLIDQQSSNEAVAVTRRQLELDSFYDDGHHRLIRLLVEQGKSSAAVQQYKSYATLLEEELGVEPDAELTRFVMQHRKEPIAKPSLPSFTTPFVGREQELAFFQTHLSSSDYRLITLVGLGGIGKTKMALKVARDNQAKFKDGAIFVPLAAVQKGSDIPMAILSAMNISLSRKEQDVKDRLITTLKAQNLLLVLDNFEQISEDGTDLLWEILQEAPSVTLLVTTREELNLQSADLFHLRGLGLPGEAETLSGANSPAVTLFELQVKRLDKSFTIDNENLSAIIKICNLVEGMPLAIELAASMVFDYTCAEIAHVIETDYAQLATTASDVAREHRSIVSVFESKWVQLTEEEKQTLAQAAIFKGPFDFEAVKAVANTNRGILKSLRNKSLLRSFRPGQFNFHPLIQQLSSQKQIELQQVVPSLAPERVRERHSNYYLQKLLKLGPELLGWYPAQTVKILLEDLENFRQAWNFGVSNRNWQFIHNTAWYWSNFYILSNLYEEGESEFERAIEQLEADTTFIRSDTLNQDELLGQLFLGLLNIVRSLSKDKKAREIGLKLESIAIKNEDEALLASVYHNVAQTHINQGENEISEVWCNKALEIATAYDLEDAKGLALRSLGNLHRQRGNYKKFERYLLQALAVQKGTKNAMEVQITLSFLGFHRRYQGDIRGGRPWLIEAKELSSNVQDHFRDAVIDLSLALSDMDAGFYLESLSILLDVFQLFQKQKISWHSGLCANFIALNCFHLHDLSGAAHYALTALDIAKEGNMREHSATANLILGYAYLERDEFEEAKEALEMAYELWNAMGHIKFQMETRIVLAALDLKQNKLTPALDQLQPVLEYLQDNGLIGCLLPFHAYWSCQSILQANDESEPALEILEKGRLAIHAQAETIFDEAIQRHYYKNVSKVSSFISARNLQSTT